MTCMDLSDLPKNVLARVCSFLPQNELACSLRPVNKLFASFLNSPDHRTVRLSHPVPHHAYDWRWGLQSPFLQTLNRASRTHLLALTATSGVLKNLKVGLQSVNVRSPAVGDRAELEEAAGAAGHLHICKFLRRRGWDWGAALQAAAQGGHRTICEWILEQEDDDFREKNHIFDAAYHAAKGGHVALMEWFLQLVGTEVAPSWRGTLLAGAAEGCDLATFQRFHRSWLGAQEEAGAEEELVAAQAPGGVGGGFNEQQPQQQGADQLPSACKQMTLDAAARSRTPDWRDKVEWLEGLGCPKTVWSCTAAAALPDALDRLTWLRERGYPVGEPTVRATARVGNVTALEYLVGRVKSWVLRGGPVADAARGGHLAALQLLHARACQIDPLLAVNAAAEGGHLAVVAWLVEVLAVDVTMLPLEVMNAAVKSNNVELLTWLFDRGLAPGNNALEWAVESGSGAAVEWLLGLGIGWEAYHHWEGGTPYSRAACQGDLAMMRCLRRLGCPWGPDPYTGRRTQVFEDCIKCALPLDTLQWLLAEGCPVDWKAARAAVGAREADDRAEVTAWLREEETKPRRREKHRKDME